MKALLTTLLMAIFGFSLAQASNAEEETPRGRILDCNGEILAANSETGERYYPQAKIASHLTGYVRKAVSGSVGASGLEKSLEETLSEGNDVSLTIDLRIQAICSQVFPADSNGSVVVIDPRSGKILAMASFPTFDANDFVPSIAEQDYKAYAMDERKPMFDRNIQARPPGSIFKVPVAIAALASDVGPLTYNCTGGVQTGQHFFKCWILSQPDGQHGEQTLSTALMNSCNAWFIQAAKVIGYPQIQQTAQAFGLGRVTDCGLPREVAGHFPDPTKLPVDREWTVGDLAMLGIGQGEIACTSVQLASLAATLAGNGEVRAPRLLADSRHPAGTNILDLGVTHPEWRAIRDTLRRNVNDERGTATKARSEVVVVSGKSATAMSGGMPDDTIGWFVGFAPFDEPTLAICVQTEKAQGSTAATIARQILDIAQALKDH